MAFRLGAIFSISVLMFAICLSNRVSASGDPVFALLVVGNQLQSHNLGLLRPTFILINVHRNFIAQVLIGWVESYRISRKIQLTSSIGTFFKCPFNNGSLTSSTRHFLYMDDLSSANYLDLVILTKYINLHPRKKENTYTTRNIFQRLI